LRSATPAGRSLREEALALARVVGEPITLSLAEAWAGYSVHGHGGDLDVARGYIEEALRLSRAIGAELSTGVSLLFLAQLAAAQGREEESWALYWELLQRAEATGNLGAAAEARFGMAWRVRGRPIEERRWLLQDALSLAQDHGNAGRMLQGVTHVAGFLADRGQAEAVARLLGGCAAEWANRRRFVMMEGLYRRVHEPAVAAARAALSEEAFQQAWDEGEKLTLDEAAERALQAPAGLAAEG
jgi:hypothetical protein